MTPLERVRDAHYRTSGKQLTGRGPYSGFCPCHHDRKRSLRVTTNDRKVSVNCLAGCDTDDILAVWGLEMADLYESCDGYSHRDCMRLSEGNTLEETTASTNTPNTLDGLVTGGLRANLISGAPFAETLAWAQSLPQGSRKAGWLQVLDEWASLTYYVNERFQRLSRRDGLDVPALTFAAGEAAVRVFEKGMWDRGEAKLCTYAKRAIRQAVQDEAARQLKSPEPKGLEWDGSVEGGREPQLEMEAVEVAPDSLPARECVWCGEPIVARRLDARFCKDACRKRYHHKRKQLDADLDGEEKLIRYALQLAPCSEDASEQQKQERAALILSARLLDRRRFRVQRLERILTRKPGREWVEEAMKINERTYVDIKALSRSQFEEYPLVRIKGRLKDPRRVDSTRFAVTEYNQDADITDDPKGKRR